MASENDNFINQPDAGSDPPFDMHMDAMLRRHLKRSNAATLVTNCAQFDAEQAGAYVENALSTVARLRFETHLAACQVCRRHVVELFRLMPRAEPVSAAVLTEAAPQDVVEVKASLPGSYLSGKETSRWLRWLDPGEWGIGKIALAGACVALVIAVAAPVLLWRKAANSATEAIARRDDAPSAAAPVPPASGDAQLSDKEAFAATGATSPAKAVTTPQPASATSTQSRVPSASPASAVAPPAVALPQSSGAGPAEQTQIALSEERARVQNPSPSASAATGSRADGFSQGNEAFRQSPQPPVQNTNQNVARDADSQVTQSAPGTQRQTTSSPAEELGRNIPQPEPKPETTDAGNRRAEEKKAAPPAASLAYTEQEKDAKNRAAAKAATATASRRMMTRQVNGKTFRLENGVWIDTAWNPDDKWPGVRLVRGSEEYDRTLAEIPALKGFFDLGHVIVLWQGKLYEVRKK